MRIGLLFCILLLALSSNLLAEDGKDDVPVSNQCMDENIITGSKYCGSDVTDLIMRKCKLWSTRNENWCCGLGRRQTQTIYNYKCLSKESNEYYYCNLYIRYNYPDDQCLSRSGADDGQSF